MMNRILAVMLVTVLAFSAAVLGFNFLGLEVQDSLIHTFLGMCAAELATMGGIKISKTWKGDDRGE